MFRFVAACVLLFAAVATAVPASAKLICVRNTGDDRLGVRSGTAMFWLDPDVVRCFRTDEEAAILQNWDVKHCEERDISVDLREQACLIAAGTDSVCVPELETRPLAETCRE